jgi:Tol biopolymer transport system component
VGLLLLSTPPISRGDSEIVVAIRYLQAKGTSHSHLYLYREDGKLFRQLTNDNSGQDSDPIFAPNGETIVFTREEPNDTREFSEHRSSWHEAEEARYGARLVLGSERLASFYAWR